MLKTGASFNTFQCVKIVRIRSYSGPYFLAFGLNTEYSSKCEKCRPEQVRIRTLFMQGFCLTASYVGTHEVDVAEHDYLNSFMEIWFREINPFYAAGFFLNTLKISENLFSGSEKRNR